MTGLTLRIILLCSCVLNSSQVSAGGGVEPHYWGCYLKEAISKLPRLRTIYHTNFTVNECVRSCIAQLRPVAAIVTSAVEECLCTSNITQQGATSYHVHDASCDLTKTSQTGHTVKMYGAGCKAGWYGQDPACMTRCGKCEASICDAITGNCPEQKCQQGFKGDKCDQVCEVFELGSRCSHDCMCPAGSSCNQNTLICDDTEPPDGEDTFTKKPNLDMTTEGNKGEVQGQVVSASSTDSEVEKYLPYVTVAILIGLFFLILGICVVYVRRRPVASPPVSEPSPSPGQRYMRQMSGDTCVSSHISAWVNSQNNQCSDYDNNQYATIPEMGNMSTCSGHSYSRSLSHNMPLPQPLVQICRDLEEEYMQPSPSPVPWDGPGRGFDFGEPRGHATLPRPRPRCVAPPPPACAGTHDPSRQPQPRARAASTPGSTDALFPDPDPV